MHEKCRGENAYAVPFDAFIRHRPPLVSFVPIMPHDVLQSVGH